MLTYVRAFVTGGLEPFWPHVVLLSVSVIASIAVGVGIIFERPKYSAAIHRVAFWLIVAGIAVEAICTIFLFVFDEGISGTQQSKIEVQQAVIEHQRDEIISLERRLAARSLSKEQFARLVTRLKPYAGQHFDIVTYWKNPESLGITNQIYDALIGAGWIYDKPVSGEFILGVQTSVLIWHDDRTVGTVPSAAAALLVGLIENGIDANVDNTPQIHAANEETINKILINVGIKP